ncbi:helix-turn-helix domain-containing protein [Bacteroides ovatus]|nr:helix-turn-helix domain-containing protein [Bacteroides ovatus]
MYRRKEAAEKLNISPTLLEKWTKQGLIKSRKIGTRIYYVEKDINEAIKNAFNSSKS